jgi:hypothetical protein
LTLKKVPLSLLLWSLGDVYLVWKVMWNWQQCLFASQKSKQTMLIEVHDLGDGDDHNDDPPLAKFPSSNFHQCCSM